MTTLEQCVKVSQEVIQQAAEERQAEETKKLDALEKYTREAFEEIGLTPIRVEGSSAFFEYQGNELHLVVKKWNYNSKGFYRVVNKCPKCEGWLATHERSINEENIGHAISHPEELQYHDCPNWMVPDVVEERLVPKTPKEKLLDALDEYIHVSINDASGVE